MDMSKISITGTKELDRLIRIASGPVAVRSLTGQLFATFDVGRDGRHLVAYRDPAFFAWLIGTYNEGFGHSCRPRNAREVWAQQPAV